MITFNTLEILVFLVNFGNFMKLTRRQLEFIENLVDLTREVDGPIHYSMLAERLGVSPFTAYDMLRLLEEKGMVTSEYQLAEGKSGPGRAERLFCPVVQKEHQQLFVEKFGDVNLSQEELREFILEQASQGEFPQQALGEELIARVPPDGPEEIRYCVGIMLVIALRLRHHDGHQKFFAYLSDILPIDGTITPANLCLLGGFAFGIMAQEETEDREWSQILLEHSLQYQEIVRCMAPDECKLLADNLMLVFTPMTQEKVTK
jgi:DNA-binding Lrp family transcriptional regulator